MTIENNVDEDECFHHLETPQGNGFCFLDVNKVCDGYNLFCMDYKSIREARKDGDAWEVRQ